MKNPFIWFKRRKKDERGIALFIALVALLLLAAIASGMMFMANTESSINYNYRDAQYTYFAAGAGLEDAREMMRTDNKYLPFKTPSNSNAQGIIYIINPAAGETVEPWNPANQFFDDELCHQFPTLVGETQPANVPCTKGAPAGSYTTYNSTVAVNGTALQGTAAALAYKWVRINLKYNNTLVPSSTGIGYQVDSSKGADELVCWENQAGHEFIINTENNLPKNLVPVTNPSEFELAALQQAIDAGTVPAVFMFGGKGKGTSTSGSTTGTTTSSTSGTTTGTTSGTTTGTTTTGSTSGTTTGTTSGSTSGTTGASGGYYKLVDDCNATSKYRFSVYLLTSMATGRNGTKRMSQYEISRTLFPGVPGGLTFNGPGATFSPPSSANFSFDGYDHAVDDTGSGGKCPGPGQAVHAITAFNSTDADSIKTAVNGKDSECASGNTDLTSGCKTKGLGFDRTKVDGSGTTVPDPLVPDVIDGNSIDPQTGTKPLDGLTTVKENTDLVESLKSSADLKVDGNIGSLADLKTKNSACTNWPMGTNDTSAPAACQGPKITVIDGSAKMTNPSGVGILVVTGDTELGGNLQWDGLILIIGTGKLTLSGGGNKTINGGIYVANTKDGTGNLGAVSVDSNGGGTSSLYYNSCAIANAVGNQSFRVITYREMTY